MNKTITTLSECFLSMPTRPSAKPAFMYKKDGQWTEVSWTQYFNLIESFGLGLIELGVKSGDRVTIFSNTRIEWSVSDYGIIGIGAITVPVYQTVTPDELEYILNNSQTKILIIENKTLLKTWNIVKPRCPSVEAIILMEESEEELTFTQVLQKGSSRKSSKGDEFLGLCSKAKSDDVITLVYTSGTTGTPKGVVLTHQQAMSEISEAFPYVGATAEDISLSFLPYAHVLGRVEHWAHPYIGYTIAFAESIERIRQNLKEIKPTFMIAVPRIFEKIYGAVMAQVENNIASSKIFHWALAVGLKVGEYKLKREPIPLVLLAQYKIAQELALKKIKTAFGDRLRFAVSGGAPLAREIALFFHACEILILEGYGLTETTAAICVNTPFDYQFGSVGKPVGDVQLRIAEDGEILVKSKKVMREYYKNEAATKEVFTDGWFQTGDIGIILPSGDLKITDRKKDLIKTAGGKYVAPQRLENLLKSHPYISYSLIHGDQKKYIVALITLDKDYTVNYAKEKNIPYSDYASLTQSPQILEMVRKGVADTNKQLASFETIKKFAVLPTDFKVETGELTPSLKVKRKVLDKKYKNEIDALYQ